MLLSPEGGRNLNPELILMMIPVGFCTLIFLGIGIWQWNSKTPVGFWTGKKPPKPEEISDVTAYNRGHAVLFFAYGIAMPVSVFAGPVLFLAATLGGIPILILCHHFLEKKYRI